MSFQSPFPVCAPGQGPRARAQGQARARPYELKALAGAEERVKRAVNPR
jgi:D-hexose-6-phosphate mutarotase